MSAKDPTTTDEPADGPVTIEFAPRTGTVTYSWGSREAWIHL